MEDDLVLYIVGDFVTHQARAGLAEIGSSLTFRGGFYNVKIRDGLRVISLQTNYASELNL